MAKDEIHKLEAKFRQGLITYDEVPENLKKKWDRSNFDIGRYRRLKRDKKSKEHGI
jgi:hypothetical protein